MTMTVLCLMEKHQFIVNKGQLLLFCSLDWKGGSYIRPYVILNVRYQLNKTDYLRYLDNRSTELPWKHTNKGNYFLKIVSVETVQLKDNQI